MSETIEITQAQLAQAISLGIETVLGDMVNLELANKDDIDAYKKDVDSISLSTSDRFINEIQNQACERLAGVVFINNTSFVFDDIITALISDEFERMRDECKYQDTGGGWRSTYQHMAYLISLFCKSKGKTAIIGKSQWPRIKILPIKQPSKLGWLPELSDI